MSDVATRDELALAREAALDAGRIARARFGRAQEVTHKSPDQPVTPADLAADDAIRHVIAASRPDDGWLSEETADGPDRLQRRRVWIVDPIDGTRSFIAGIPEFTVCVALAVDGVATVGVVFNPITGELFAASRGEGAWLESVGGPRDVVTRRLAVSGDVARRADRRLVLLASRTELAAGEFEAFTDCALEPAGSTANKLVGVAAGRADAYLSRGPKSEWDVCAGTLLVEEAGGRVTDLRGEALTFNRADPSVHGILAANREAHETLLERVRRLPDSARLRRAGGRQRTGEET
ncbi:MAG: 3'(2'),5'-bisphosphate nucleotidase CysQ [Longimicrobiales bacterium]